MFDLLDRVERLPRVGALVVAVLEDLRPGGRAADVTGFIVHRRQGQREHLVPGRLPPAVVTVDRSGTAVVLMCWSP